jgi:tetratricopeptide (TPR) repeat protein
MRYVLVLLLLATALRAAPAQAQPEGNAAAPRVAPGRAEELLLQGNQAYRAGDYRRALERYQASYELTQFPLTLFNMAQCLRRLGERDRAIELYSRYLVAERDPVQRERVQRLLQDLRELQRREQTAAAPAAPAPAPSSAAPSAAAPSVLPAAPLAAPAPVTGATPAAGESDGGVRPWYRRWYVWAIIGVAVAGGVTAGAVLGTRGDGIPSLGQMSFPR